MSSSEEEPPADKALCDGARQKAWLLDTCFEAWHYNKIAKGIAGWAARDTMICDLPEHRKAQPNHPDPMGPPRTVWESAKSEMASGSISMTCADSTPWGRLVTHAPGTSYPRSGPGPAKVSPLRWPTLPYPSTQHRLGNGHLYVEGTAHGRVLTMLANRSSRQVSKTIVLPLLCLCGGRGE